MLPFRSAQVGPLDPSAWEGQIRDLGGVFRNHTLQVIVHHGSPSSLIVELQGSLDIEYFGPLSETGRWVVLATVDSVGGGVATASPHYVRYVRAVVKSYTATSGLVTATIASD